MQIVEVERVGEREEVDGRTEVLVRTSALDQSDDIIVTKLANAADGLLVDPGSNSTTNGPGGAPEPIRNAETNADSRPAS